MIGAGALAALAAAWFLWKLRKGGVPSRGAVAVAVALPFLPLAANSFGWLFTEIGRQPWVVFGLMPTAEQGVSPARTPVRGGGPRDRSGSRCCTACSLVVMLDVYVVRRSARRSRPGIRRPTGASRPRPSPCRPSGYEGYADGSQRRVWFRADRHPLDRLLRPRGVRLGGCGILPVIGRNEPERRAMLRTIGPVWDGNEVWLLVAGGATFAAFPEWYATLFSAFYLALFVILVALIVRGVGIEIRNKRGSLAWRNRWDIAIAVSSLVPALLWGVAFANIVAGTPIDADKQFQGNLLTLINPFGLLGGLTTLLLFQVHGLLFLVLKTEGEIRERARARILPVGLLTAVVAVAFLALGDDPHGQPRLRGDLGRRGARLHRGAAGQPPAAQREAWSIASSAAIALAVASLFVALFPDVMPSSLDPAWSLTTTNAASTPYTLSIMTVVAVIFVPLVLVYQGWTYWVFRRRCGSPSSRRWCWSCWRACRWRWWRCGSGCASSRAASFCQAGLLVLVLAPEAYLPLRLVGAEFHAGRRGWPRPTSSSRCSTRRHAPRGERSAVPDPGSNGLFVGGLAVRSRGGARRPSLSSPSSLSRARSSPSSGRWVREVDVAGGGARVGGAGARVDLHRGRGARHACSGRLARGRLAWVPQVPFLFAAPIAANVRLGRPSASAAELGGAVDAAGLGPLVGTHLPDGLDGVLGEGGAGLSSGERRRLGIARAFVRGTPSCCSTSRRLASMARPRRGSWLPCAGSPAAARSCWSLIVRRWWRWPIAS